MKRFSSESARQRRDLDNIYNLPTHRRLKTIALVAIALAIVLLAGSAFFIGKLSFKALLIIRGCAGLFAILFVVLTAILVYRVNCAYIQQRTHRRSDM